MGSLTLEAIDAGPGDALLLHHGDPAAPGLVLVDGGLARTYKTSLAPRLAEIGESLGGAPRIDLVVVSHIDDDHIVGVVELAADLARRADDRLAPHVLVRGLWHNSFDDVVPGTAAAAATAVAPWSLARAAGVRKGVELRDHARRLGWRVNEPFGDLVVAGRPAVSTGNGLALTVIAPTARRLDDLRREWAHQLEKLRAATGVTAAAAQAVDKSVTNLSSVVILAESAGHTALLTGDAGADDIIEGVRQAGLGDGGKLHVDILKMPHHGSRRNVSCQLLTAITADTYVFSGDGRHDNPDVETFRLLGAVRDPRDFVVVLTYMTPALHGHFTAEAVAGRRWRVVVRDPAAPSVVIHAGDAPSTVRPGLEGFVFGQA